MDIWKEFIDGTVLVFANNRNDMQCFLLECKSRGIEWHWSESTSYGNFSPDYLVRISDSGFACVEKKLTYGWLVETIRIVSDGIKSIIDAADMVRGKFYFIEI